MDDLQCVFEMEWEHYELDDPCIRFSQKVMFLKFSVLS